MTLHEKVNKIIDECGISNTRFADLINVSRPTISHIMSGRNKPSIDIVQKIISTFPELGSNWILDGEDLDDNVIKQIAASQQLNREGVATAGSSDFNEKSYAEHKPERTKPQPPQVTVPEPKTAPPMATVMAQSKSNIERIIIHYTDGTMEVIKGGGQII